jgi:AcrR family transcriptional regulator
MHSGETSVAPPAVRPRRRRPEERAQQIMDAAVRLFAEQGYERTTTRAIAQEAGISEGTIYKYFDSKRALLFAITHQSIVDPLKTLLEKMPDATDDQLIRAIIHDRLALWDRAAPFLKVVISEALFNPELTSEYQRQVTGPALAMLEAYITKRIADGAFRPVNPAVAARSLIGLLFFFFHIWHNMFGMTESIQHEALVEELARIYLDGVRQH